MRVLVARINVEPTSSGKTMLMKTEVRREARNREVNLTQRRSKSDTRLPN